MASVNFGVSEPDVPSRHEVLGIVLASGTLLIVLALLSYHPELETNLVGPVGLWFAGTMLTAFGYCAWLIPMELGLWALRLIRGRHNRSALVYLCALVIFMIAGCTVFDLMNRAGGRSINAAMNGASEASAMSWGGTLGAILAEVSISIVGLAGAWVLHLTIVCVTWVERSGTSFKAILLNVRAAFHRVIDAWRAAKEIDQGVHEEHSLTDALAEQYDRFKEASQQEIAYEEPAKVERPRPEPAPAMLPGAAGKKEPRVVTSNLQKAKSPLAAKKPAQDKPVTTAARANGKPFHLPPTSLLEAPAAKVVNFEEDVLKLNAVRLVEKLGAYGVQGRVDEIHPGPVVTMYEFEPESGTKVAKIASLADDLAMALAAQKVRIVAPIPGKARVGFELPNDVRQTVALREILEDPEWQSLDATLPVAFGQDIEGKPYYGDLARMPHLLVAGATGSGKSVGINVMICSLLQKKTPEEVRLLMIDPKVVELAVYDGIPHLLLPVVTDMKKAARALKWAVDEMERRYQLFADAGARNITSFNDRVERVLRGELAVEKLMPRRVNKVRAQGVDGEEVLIDPDDGESADALDKPPEKLPFIVVIVDEFADLMMVSAKDVEASIARLAQKARAAGIHVILATQRPSVDVITGMIKANFPARVAFKVSQREDSKTILGRQGAEHLLGMGDMLIVPPGASDLKRVHSAFISEEEVRAMCDFLRAQGSPVYDHEILKPREDEDEEGGASASGASADDPLYDRSVQIVAEAGYCSISHLQRQLTIGYNKAAKLVERMEKEGVVGPANPRAGGRREVLVQA